MYNVLTKISSKTRFFLFWGCLSNALECQLAVLASHCASQGMIPVTKLIREHNDQWVWQIDFGYCQAKLHQCISYKFIPTQHATEMGEFLGGDNWVIDKNIIVTTHQSICLAHFVKISTLFIWHPSKHNYSSTLEGIKSFQI